jgi:hypothetical protein
MREILCHLILPNLPRIIMEQDLETTFQQWQIRALNFEMAQLFMSMPYNVFHWLGKL